jgi:hypothetical protein
MTLYSKKIMVRFAVAIPTYHLHYCFLERILTNISEQVLLPDLVSVSASSCRTDEEKETLASIRSRPWPFRLILQCYEKVAFAAENRNRAAAAAIDAGADIISFFDCDDLMHPRRIQRLEAAFRQHTDIDCILHCFDTSDSFKEFDHTLDFTVVKDAYLISDTLYSPFTKSLVVIQRVCFEDIEGIQYGHVTVRAHCFDKVLQNTGALGYEDSLYLTDLLKANYNVACIPYKLSMYSLVDGETMGKNKESMFLS